MTSVSRAHCRNRKVYGHPGRRWDIKSVLEIRELRNKYQLQLGDKFSIAGFHMKYERRCHALEVLEKKMDAWLKALTIKLNFSKNLLLSKIIPLTALTRIEINCLLHKIGVSNQF